MRAQRPRLRRDRFREDVMRLWMAFAAVSVIQLYLLEIRSWAFFRTINLLTGNQDLELPCSGQVPVLIWLHDHIRLRIARSHHHRSYQLIEVSDG